MCLSVPWPICSQLPALTFQADAKWKTNLARTPFRNWCNHCLRGDDGGVHTRGYITRENEWTAEL